MTTPDAATAPPPRRRRKGTIADMARSLGVVGLALLALMLVTVRQTPDRPYASPDVAATVAAARANAPFPVLAATTLPAGWYANYANFDAVQGASGRWYLHIGYVLPKGDHVGYLEVNATNQANPEQAMPSIAPGTQPSAHITVAGIDFAIHTAGVKGVDNELWFASGTGTDGNRYIIQVMSSLDHDAMRAFVLQHFRTSGAIAVQG